MTNTELSRYAGWSALASATFTILGLVTLIMFFALGQPWGAINDISSVILALSLLPVLLALHRLHRRAVPTISLAAFVIGVLGMLIAVMFQTLLIIRVIAFAQTSVVVPAAFGLVGASLMVYGYFARTIETMPGRLALLCIIAGASYVVVIAGFILGGQAHPLTTIGGLSAVICYPIWAAWFGRLLLSGRLRR